jgi:hypothetical protein
MTPGVRRAVGGGVALGSALLLAWLSRAPMWLSRSDAGLIRVAWSARPERVEHCVTRTDEELRDVPSHMRQRVACEGRSARYRMLVQRDGEVLADEVVTGAGARHDRPIYVLREFPAEPGALRLEVSLQRLDSVAPGSPREADGDAPSAGGTAPDRERRERQERGRRLGEAMPPSLSLRTEHELAARSVLLITYDPESRALVARSADGSP